MSETGIQMGLLAKGAYTPEMGVIDVGIHPEEPFEYCLNYLCEVWRE